MSNNRPGHYNKSRDRELTRPEHARSVAADQGYLGREGVGPSVPAQDEAFRAAMQRAILAGSERPR